MEEDTELEEGEAKEPCDPDKDFSYLDQKLQLLLGDQQKEFQGCTLSTEKLGSKFGGYGTFLPTQARGPSVLATPPPPPPPHPLEPISVLTEGSVESVKHTAGLADKPVHAQSHSEPPTQKMLKKKNGVSNDPTTSKKVMIRFTVGKGGEKESQPKAIQNGLSVDHVSSASLGDENKHNLSDADLSPEPSPRSMIKIMTSYQIPRDLLSPLPPSFLEYLDRKEKAPITLKVSKPAKAPLNTRTPGGKVDPDRGNQRKIKADEREKQAAIELRKVSEVVVDGGKRARRDSDVEKKIQNEPVLKVPAKVVRNDASKGEQQEASLDKVLEGPSKEDAESGKEQMRKSSRGKRTDLKAELAGIGSKEKEGSDVKVSRKLTAVQDKDSKETTQAKEIIKQQGRKNREAAKMGTSEKDGSDKVGSLTDGWKQGKDESKEALVFKGDEVGKEVKKESQKRDPIGDFTAGDGHKETIKATTRGEHTTKNEPINIGKDVMKDQKRSKTARDAKAVKKERDREQGPVLEAAPKADYEKVQGIVDTAAPAPIAMDPVVMPTQLVLDNWVQCDKCETWRLLLPGIETPHSSAKWNCKMMDWLPGMNNCKFTEEETTAAVYRYLGLQNPKLVPTTGAPAEMPPFSPVVEALLKKPTIPVDTKKGSRATTGKKGLVGSVLGGGVKTAGSKCTDGTVNNKSLNDVGLDSNADEVAYTRILADKNKLKEKEKKKRQRTSEGDMALRKKSVAEEKPIQGSGVKHSGGLNADMLQGEKEVVHAEQTRLARERLDAEAQALPSIPAKRKKQMEIGAEVNETQSLKKSKGNRVNNNDASLEEDVKVVEHVSFQRGRAGSNVTNANDTHHSRQTDIGTQNFSCVLKDYRSSPEVHKSGESEKGLDQKDNGRATDVKMSKLELNKVLDRRKKLKEDEKESEQRAVKRPKQDVHGQPRLESNRHITRTILPSEQEPEILEVAASPAAGVPSVIASKNEVFKKDSLNHSTLSKVYSSPESSRTGSKAHGSSPIESTVSSSPVRFRKGEREQSRNQQGGPDNISVPNEGVLQQHSWSASPMNAEDASHPYSGDEGEFRHAGTWHGADISRKLDRSSGARDEEWNWDEHRGGNPGFAYDNHEDHSGQRPECNWDRDELDGQYERRVNQNSHYDGDHDQGVRDPWPNEQADAQEDPYSREHRTRDDWGRPSSRESRLDKTGGGSWHDEQQLEQGEEVPTKDEALPAASEHGARDDHLVSKGTSWEGERAAPVSKKENDSATMHSLDTPVPGKRPSSTASARVKEDTGKVLKQERQPSILSKALVNMARDAGGVTCSPVKREHSQVHNPAFSVAKKEARALKHSADHLKNEPGLEVESTNLYLQAALKFLQAAAIAEKDNTDINRAGETQSMVVYNDTATLCKYCAGQYERSRDMAAAALAYTCAAVALGHRMLCKNASFARDCNELLTAAQQQASGPPITSNGPLLRPPLPSRSADKPGPSLPMVRDTGVGESPSSSSASDVDNLNNQSLVPSDKGTMTQIGRIGMASPQTMPGTAAPSSNSIPSHLRSSFIRVLKDASDMSNLLEAWQKAAIVTAKAEATCNNPKGMLAVKKVGELGGFGDIETVVHLVRVAMDTIGH